MTIRAYPARRLPFLTAHSSHDHRAMVPLSEKAKGKRRAADIDAQGASSSSSAAQPQERQLVVRFTEGTDLTITIDQLDTVKDVLNKVCCNTCGRQTH